MAGIAHRDIALARWAAGLAAVSAALGLAVPALYRDTDAMVAQARGADAITLLVAAPLLLWSLRDHGGRRAAVTYGTLGYLAYTYAVFAFAVVINWATLLHIAVLGLSGWALVLGWPAANRASWPAGARLPRRATICLLVALAALFGLLWTAQIVGAAISGELPPGVADLELPTSPVYVLDLALLLPVLLATARGLHRGREWAPPTATAVLVFIVLIGLSIVGLTVAQLVSGLPVDLVVTGAFAGITAFAATLLVRSQAENQPQPVDDR